jgi:hypothetical protein
MMELSKRGSHRITIVREMKWHVVFGSAFQ